MGLEQFLDKADPFRRFEEVHLKGDRGSISTKLFLPRKKGKYKAVVFSQGLVPPGLQPVANFWPRYLTSLGVAVLVPTYEGHIGERFVRRDIDHAVNAFEYLQNHEEVDGDSVGMVGFSYGGLLSLLSSTKIEPDYVVTVCAPTDLEEEVRFAACDPEASWMARKIMDNVLPKTVPDHLEELPPEESDAIPDIWKDHGLITALHRTGDASHLDSISTYTRQRIEDFSPLHQVDQMKSRYLIIHGVDDKIVPYAQAEAFHQAMQAAGKESELFPVDGLGHIFFPRDLKRLAGHVKKEKGIAYRRIKEFVLKK